MTSFHVSTDLHRQFAETLYVWASPVAPLLLKTIYKGVDQSFLDIAYVAADHTAKTAELHSARHASAAPSVLPYDPEGISTDDQVFFTQPKDKVIGSDNADLLHNFVGAIGASG